MPGKSMWNGTVSFGLVSVPVKLYKAVSPKSVAFHQINSKTGARVGQQRVDKSSGAEVPWDDIVKGYELSPDHHIIISDDDLNALAPTKTKAITLESFVPLAEIDPLCYEATYYLGPADPTAGRAYRLLALAMQKKGQVGVGKFVLRSKEKIVALRANAEGVLICSTLVFADEILNSRETAAVEEAKGEPTPAELKQAGMLIDALSGNFDHSVYQDSYREEVLKLIEARANGGEVPVPVPAEAVAPPTDLMSALEASLRAVKPSAKGKVPAKRAPRRKVAA